MFKKKAKDGLSVLGVGIAYSVVRLLLFIVNVLIAVGQMLLTSNEVLAQNIKANLAAQFGLSGILSILIGVVVNFVVGSAFALLYNVLITKTKFAKKY